MNYMYRPVFVHALLGCVVFLCGNLIGCGPGVTPPLDGGTCAGPLTMGTPSYSASYDATGCSITSETGKVYEGHAQSDGSCVVDLHLGSEDISGQWLFTYDATENLVHAEYTGEPARWVALFCEGGAP